MKRFCVVCARVCVGRWNSNCLTFFPGLQQQLRSVAIIISCYWYDQSINRAFISVRVRACLCCVVLRAGVCVCVRVCVPGARCAVCGVRGVQVLLLLHMYVCINMCVRGASAYCCLTRSIGRAHLVGWLGPRRTECSSDSASLRAPPTPTPTPANQIKKQQSTPSPNSQLFKA